jgi:predicted Ser/Thr protein kinase
LPTIDGGAPVPPQAVAVAPLQRLGHFVLLAELGRGGMGTVFAAYDERLDRKVAIKLLHLRNRPSHVHRRKILREAQAMARISHPNVVSVYEVGEVSDRIFIAMEFIDGQTLAQWQRQPGRTWQEVLAMYLQAGHGLAAAHASGLIHRDFKPDNVLVSRDGRARVLDFGLARRDERLLDSEDPAESAPSRSGAVDKLTQDGLISGTPGYMAPEQYDGQPVDARSDQFSFCAALFEALFGTPPFAGRLAAEIASNTLAGHVQPRPKNSPVPEELHRALLRGLANRAEQRFPRMDELLAALLLETTDSAEAAATSRRRFVNATLLSVLGIMVVIQAVRARSPLQYRQVVLATVLAIAVVFLVGLAQRRSLLRNSYHRRLWLLMLISGLQHLGLRLVGWRLSVNLQLQLAPIELVCLAAMAALGGAYISRTMFWLAGLLALAAAALTLVGPAMSPLASPMFPLALCWLLWEWTTGGAARRRKGRGGPAGGSGESAAKSTSTSTGASTNTSASTSASTGTGASTGSSSP